VIGDGGTEFFARFRARGDTAGADPLDRYTLGVVRSAVATALASSGVAHEIVFPFLAGAPGSPVLPIQRVGQAAGLPPAGPLGLQVHPVFGPWWAYRALVVLACPADEEPPLPSSCADCPAPCESACPGHAVARDGFLLAACVSQRRADVARDGDCQLSCVARLRCVAGPEHRYPDEQLAFHMASSLVYVSAGPAAFRR
jgi:hypothetical protein